MNTRITLLTAACALALVACGDKSSSTAETAAPAPTDYAAPVDTTAPAPAANAAAAIAESGTAANAAPVDTAPVDTTTPAPAAPPSDKPAVAAASCATEIEGNDAMQYNVGSITVPASCTQFKITLKHTGRMPVAAMGHNVVITKSSDMPAVTADGMGAGAQNGYLKPGDPRVIAHTKLIGGGQTTSVSFAVSKIKGNGPYEFFCSFPGHSSIMKGTIAVQ